VKAFDPIEIEIFKNAFVSIAEEMGAVLGRTALSPNIKERKDYSCALFNRKGETLAQGSHIPVHLGAMPLSVQVPRRQLGPENQVAQQVHQPGQVLRQDSPVEAGLLLAGEGVEHAP